MSSSDGTTPARRLARLALALPFVAALSLAACTVQPLYGSGPTGKAVTGVLSAIDIKPVPTRIGQEVRNQLIADLGNASAAPLYSMTLAVEAADGSLGVTAVENAPVYTVTVSATYVVRALATGDIVLRGTGTGTASWDRVNQLYANDRARIDAQKRAAALAADDIRIRLSTAAAKGTI